MKKRFLRPRVMVPLVLIIIFLAGIGAALWIYFAEIYTNFTPSLTSVSCEASTNNHLCNVKFSLKNNLNREVTTDLNGNNGPGFAESGVYQINAILDDGSSVPVYEGDMNYSGMIGPNETVNLTGAFVLPDGRTVTSVKILDAVFPANR